MFRNQPSGLFVLSLANTGERFGYFTMISTFLLYLQAKFGFDSTVSGQIYACFLAFVYFLPLIGGWIADRWNFSKCVVTGLAVMFVGYLLLAIPTEVRSSSSIVILLISLMLIAVGTGLFKGNIQVMIGDLYNTPELSGKRDAAFSLFYMAINIGAMFAPSVATALCDYGLRQGDFVYVAALPELCNSFLDGTGSLEKLIATAGKYGMTVSPTEAVDFAYDYLHYLSLGYVYGFGVACISLIISGLIYFGGFRTFRHVISGKQKGKPAKGKNVTEPEFDSKQTRERIIALLLVFAVVIFFWMVYSQNGATLTEFAKSCTSPEAAGWSRIGFNVWALVAICFGVYALFSLVQSKKTGTRIIAGVVLILAAVGVVFSYITTPNPLTGIQPQEYQQFDPFFVVTLTPVSLAFFDWLANRRREPSAPRKIGYGMILAGGAFAIMMIGSWNIIGTSATVSPNWLISCYLVLTIAELLLSPMGLSFVTKVAPPKYKGSMMGGWFAATAIGNYLVSIPMMLWGKMEIR